MDDSDQLNLGCALGRIFDGLIGTDKSKNTWRNYFKRPLKRIKTNENKISFLKKEM